VLDRRFPACVGIGIIRRLRHIVPLQTEVITMELSEKKIEQLNKQPIVETQIKRSEDGKWVVHKTTITDIKPVTYFEKVLA
jgi:hypothetical protein